MGDKSPLILLLARHGESTANQSGTFQGQTDTELSPRGSQQARLLARHLTDFPLQAVYSSPLKRVLATAIELADPHQLAVQCLSELKELDVGELTGIPYADAEKLYPRLMKDFKADLTEVHFPGGETITQLKNRAMAGYEVIRKNHPDGGMVAIVSHNLCLRVLCVSLLGLPLTFIRQLALDSAAFSLLSLPPQKPPILVSWNQTSHLGYLPKLAPGGLLGL